MTHATGRVAPEEDSSRRELEQLGEELSRRRGMHVSLAPDGDDQPVLEVVSDLPRSPRGTRISWRDGSFWLSTLEQVPGGDIRQAADWIAAALGWSRQLGLIPPRGAPGET